MRAKKSEKGGIEERVAVADGAPAGEVVIEKATLGDAQAIYDLINGFADRDDLLHRPLSEIFENIRDFFVARQDGVLIGCAALHVLWSDLAELRATAVSDAAQGRDVGRKLADACVAEAERLGLSTVFCLTKRPGFFAKVGFHQASVSQLPRKVWGECFRCVKFPKHCNEVAMVIQVGPPKPDRVGMYRPDAQPLVWVDEVQRGEGVVAREAGHLLGEPQ
jgi:amino-acid N-acetyltransferase